MPAADNVRRYAVIDIGSNAVRLLVGVCDDAGAFLPELFTRVPLTLGRGGFATRRINADNRRRLSQTLTGMRLLIDSMRPVARWRAVATAAVREAKNRHAVLAAIKDDCGIRVRVLSGNEEAKIIGRFAAAQFSATAVLNIDTGGGSTDCALIHDDNMTYASFGVGTSRAAADAELTRLRRWLRQAVATHGDGMIVCASGGSVRKLAELCGGKITAQQLGLWRRRIAALPPLAVAARYDLSPDRAVNMKAAIDIYRFVLAAVGGGREMLPISGGLGEAVIQQLANEN